MAGLNGLGVEGSQHGMMMSPGLWMGLVVCVLGLGFQFTTVKEGGEIDGGEDESDLRGYIRGKDDEDSITKSSRSREVSKRRNVSPFDSPNGLVMKFLEGNIMAKRRFARRKALVQQVAWFRGLGLGPKHPDVIELSEESERIEGELMEEWVIWRARDASGKGERMSGRGW